MCWFDVDWPFCRSIDPLTAISAAGVHQGVDPLLVDHADFEITVGRPIETGNHFGGSSGCNLIHGMRLAVSNPPCIDVDQTSIWVFSFERFRLDLTRIMQPMLADVA